MHLTDEIAALVGIIRLCTGVGGVVLHRDADIAASVVSILGPLRGNAVDSDFRLKNITWSEYNDVYLW